MAVHTSGDATQVEWRLPGNRPSETADGRWHRQSVPQERLPSKGWRVWSEDQERRIKWPVVESLYDVADTTKVGNFVFEKPYVLDLLLEAYGRLCGLFGQTSTIRLDFNVDPEIPGRRYLAARVVTGVAVDEALALMDCFDGWWLDHIARAGRDLLFIPEFA
jgi:hypothetical protein